MPKKPARNAFFFFMKELQPQLQREGRVFPNGIADVVPIAHPRWKALPQKEKDRFENMAKEYKGKMRGLEGDKHRLDNVGNVLAYRTNPDDEMRKKRQRESQDVTSRWPPGIELANESFFFINFQLLCKTDDGLILPCEMAMVEFSLKKGIIKSYHKFIDAGRIPTGYRYSCMQQSEDYHKIEIENFSKADANYLGIWVQIENFLNPNGEKPDYPPLYCLETELDDVEFCLQWLYDRSMSRGPSQIKKLYILENLVCDIYLHIEKQISLPSAIQLLTTTQFDYTPNTRCEYHEEIDCKYCSLGVVQRYVYALSDALSDMYEFKLTRRHLPAVPESSAAAVLMPVHMAQSLPKAAPRSRGHVTRPPPSQRTAPAKVETPTYIDKDEDDIDDDDDNSGPYEALRRPNMPAPWFPMQNGNPTVDTADAEEFPSLGASRDFPKKFASRAAAPNPNSTPLPPPSWQQSAQPQSFPSIQPDYDSSDIGPTPGESLGRQPAPVRQVIKPSGVWGQAAPRGIAPIPQGQGRGMAIAPEVERRVPPQPQPVISGTATEIQSQKQTNISAPSGMPVGRGFRPAAPQQGIPARPMSSWRPPVQQPPNPALLQQMSQPVSASGAMGLGRGRGPAPVGRGFAPPGMGKLGSDVASLNIGK